MASWIYLNERMRSSVKRDWKETKYGAVHFLLSLCPP